VALPERVPIAYEPGFRTDTIGRYAGGQFYAAIHGAHRAGEDSRDEEQLGWYVYLHLFDDEGRHQRSDISRIGVGPYLRGDLATLAEQRLAELLDQIPDRQYGDIAIRPFRVDHDGVTFGLIDQSDDVRGDWAELYPEELGFHEPWDGLYDT
jgi:formate hydrogenlyase regulatory protein HycA